MEHKGTAVIVTDRLELRPFTVCDAEGMFSTWACDDAVTRYLTWPSHGDVSVTRDVLSSWVPHYCEVDYYNWAVVLRDDRRLIGNISVVKIMPEVCSFQIGYCLGRKFWHNGYMSEALSAVIGFLFSEVGALRIEALHDVANGRSGKVMERCGMTREGVLRGYGRNNTGICDCALWSIMSNEWRAEA